LSQPVVQERWLEISLLFSVFVLRVLHLDQPILEGYVGRQVPTAMVARNLARGSGFLSPLLDTGPFPNRFLVEPPIDAQVVAWVSSLTSLGLDPAGRLVSAAATTLAAWGLFGLVNRRNGLGTAVATLIAFGAFPVTIRYGRAFQPDSLAMGLIVAGLRLWDSGDKPGLVAGWCCLALGLAQKVSWGFVLAPLIVAILAAKPRRIKRLAMTTLLPALCWYVYAGLSVASTSGSAASSDNAAQWLNRLSPTAYLDVGRYLMVVKDLGYRAFTPLGAGLALLGLVGWRRADRLWRVWILAAAAALVVLFGKLHHDYYWMMAAPPTAVWVGLAIDSIRSRSRWIAVLVIVVLVGLGLFQSRSTWHTPDDWRDAQALAGSIRTHTSHSNIIAPEALLYLGDRRGCRLEYDTEGARRAANEWRPSPRYTEVDPAELVNFYRRESGARYFADLAPRIDDATRIRLHQRVRNDPRSRILDDQPGRYLLVIFDDPVPLERVLK